MIEATLVGPSRAPAGSTPAPLAAWRSPAVARRQRVARRYELSDEVRAFLQAKYLGSQAPARMAAADVRPIGGWLDGGCGSRLDEERSGRSSAALRRVLMAAKLLLLAATLFMFGALAFASEARADTVFEQGGIFTGEQRDQFSFNASNAGTLLVSLSDLDGDLNSQLGLPANSFSSLSSLTLTVWSSSGELGSCSLSMPCQGFTIAGPGTYYAMIDAVAGSNPMFPGLNIAIDSVVGTLVAPVPLPASLWLVLSGIAATFWSVRRRVGAPRDSRVGHPRRISLPPGRLAL